MHADNVHEGLLRGHPQLKVQVRGFLFVDNNIVSKSSTLKLPDARISCLINPLIISNTIATIATVCGSDVCSSSSSSSSRCTEESSDDGNKFHDALDLQRDSKMCSQM